MTQLTLLVDLDRCVGCHSCAVACKQLHGVPSGLARMRVDTVGPRGTFPELEMYYLPVMCLHCEEAPCVASCPSGAGHKRDDGLVLVDRDICTGCGTCVEACPFGARFVRPEAEVAESCTLCVERAGSETGPACVATCSTRALAVGDLADETSGVARRARETGSHVFTLQSEGRPGLPRTLYILRRQPWRGRA